MDVVVDPSRANRGTRAVERGLGRVQNRADALRTTLNRAFAFIGIAVGLRQLQKLVDAFTNVQNRLKLVTQGTTELADVTEELFNIATRTRSAFDATAELFARLALSSKELGRTQQELLRFTESLNRAVILSGASAKEARNGIIQLSQGLATGALRGDELRSVLEQLPLVAEVISKELGVTRGELRSLGEQGKITADIILDAFKNAREELEQNFANTVPTIAQAFEVLRTRLIRFIGAVDMANGISQKLSRTIIFVGENIEQFARSVAALATFMITVLIQRAIVGTIKALAALSVALLTNPLFAIGALIAGSTAAIIAFGDQIQVSRTGLANLQDVVITTFNAISQIAEPILRSLGDTLAAVFGGQLPTLRELAEAVALTFDQIVGAVRGSVFLVRDLLLTQLRKVFDGAIAIVRRFGLTVKIAFESIGNGLAELFTDPIGIIIRSIKTLLNSVAGAVALAESLGAIAKGSRVTVETAINAIEVSLARLEAPAPPPVFDTEKTRVQLAALDAVIVNIFGDIGTNLKTAFLEGFDQETILGLVKSVFDEADGRAKDRRVQAQRDAAQARLDRSKAAGRQVERADAPESAEIAKQVQALIRRIEVQERINEQTDELRRLMLQGALDANTYQQALEQLQLSGLEASKKLEDGFTRAFIKIKQEAEDLAAVGESVVNVFADNATDALTEFARTGQFSFKAFANAILEDLTRIIVRLLVVKALNAVLGGGGGQVATTAADATTASGSRQEGGTVQPNRSFLVGERGPELFVPDRTGTIVPNQSTQAAEQKEMSVTIVNVKSEDEVPQAIEDGGSDEAIVNAIGREKDRIRAVLQ